MSYCKERDFHNSTSPTDFYEFAIPSVVSVIYHVDFRLHANVWNGGWLLLWYLPLLPTPQFLHFLGRGFLKETCVEVAERGKGDKPSKGQLYLIMFLTSSLCTLPICQENNINPIFLLDLN